MCNHDKRFQETMGCKNGCMACELEATAKELHDLAEIADTARCAYEMRDDFNGSYDMSQPMDAAMGALMQHLMVISMTTLGPPAPADGSPMIFSDE